ncbi:MAG: TetR family transcriptional regulator [Candidatus Nanopelagicales bacterium]|nr:TetR family transcriptional regulator [Candidatus Nanopelagicales bacterium]
MARTRSAQQVAVKREHISNAAVSVMAREGIAAANLRGVAHEADISTGAVLYYFNEFDAVVRSAILIVAEKYATTREQALAQSPDAVASLRRLVSLGLPDTIDGSLAILYQAHFIDDPSGEITLMLSELNARQRVLYEKTIQRGIDYGVFTPNQDPRAIAAIALCMEDAHSLYAMRDYGVGMRRARSALRQYLGAALGVRL